MLPIIMCHFLNIKRIEKFKRNMSNIISKLSLILFVVLISIVSGHTQSTIWLEDFQDLNLGDEADVGATAWSVACTGGGTCGYLDPNAGDYFQVWDDGAWWGGVGITSSHYFCGSDMDGEAKWTSEVIDISNFVDVSVSALLVESNFNGGTSDYLKAYYSIDGGAETLLTNGNQTGGFGSATASSSGLLGSTIQIFIYVYCNDANDFPAFDDVLVTGFPVSGPYYARNGGGGTHWSDDDIWSLIGPGEAQCSCQPGPGADVIIDGFDVKLDDNASVEIANLTITNNYNGDKGKLEIKNGFDLLVTENVFMKAEDIAQDVELKIKNTSKLQINGNLDMVLAANHGENKSTKLKLENTSTVDVEGQATLTINNNNSANKKYIELKNNSTFTCENDFIINQEAGNDVILWLQGNAVWNVSNDLTINQNGGDVLQFLFNSGAAGTAAKLNVGGNFLINKDGGNDVEIILDQADSEITVGGNLTFDNSETGAGDLLYLQLDNGSDLDVDGNIIFSAAAQSNTYVEVNNASKIEIAGDITRTSNYGILDFNGTSTIEFNGVSNTQIFPADAKTGGGSDYFDYQNVLLNNTFGTPPQITMEGNATVHGSIIFTDGIVSSSLSELLIIDDGATSTNGSVSSHVDGPIRKIGDDVFVFPVGNNGIWARLEMQNLANYNPTTEFTCQYFRSPAVFPAALSIGVDHVSLIEYWDLTRTNDADASCNISLFWEDETTSGISDMADLALCHYSSLTGQWEDQGGTGNDLGLNGSIASTNPLTSFSPIAFGSRGGTNVLPVELVSFEANLNIDKVELHWVTASEETNELFTIERSQDGIIFEEILQVEGAGESSNRIEYFDIDYEPLTGISYYRLKQTDTDGKFTYSAKVFVDYLGTNLLGQAGTDIKIWPNPNEGTHLNIQMNGYEPENEVLFVVTDIVGREYYSKVLLTDMDGHITNAIDLDNTLPVGIYVITGSDQNHLYSSKLIVK